jgi:perosamine synthetase
MNAETLVRQIPFGRPWLSDEERAAVMDVLNGHVLTHGPQCKEFEKAFADFLGPEAHAVTVSSCMAALHLAYLHFGIGAGDDVLVPAQTHAATAHAVEWVGARPVFVDCDPATGNVTPAGIEAALTSRTRALSVVHYVGIPCDMRAIMAIAERHNLKVIEDCAIALGARLDGTHVGLFGDAGCFSFYPVKHITTGEGGMFVTRHKEVADKVARLRAFGVDRTHSERAIPGMYDVPELGLNYRMSEMQAAIGVVQMRRIGGNLSRREANFRTLKAALDGIPEVAVVDAPGPEFSNSHYCLTTRLVQPVAGGRNGLVARLNARGVGTSIYYPQPVPRLTYYRKKYGYDAGAFRGAAALSDDAIALPVGPHLDEDDMRIIAAEFRNAVQAD